MPLWTCETCGAQFPSRDATPDSCPNCEDERQFVGWSGQTFLAREELARKHRLVVRDDLGLTGIGIEPSFAIGQRALLVPDGDGCVMWDCIPLATDEAVQYVAALGGLKAIAISHPHYYGALADWSDAFGGVPVYLHADDRAFVTRPHPAIVHWTGDTHRISDDVLLLRTGGHFAGATVLHCARGADGKGALLTGDIAQVTMDRRFVSFMFLPELHSAQRRRGATDRGRGRAACLRPDLRRLVGSQRRQRRQGGVRCVGRALSGGHRLSGCADRIYLAGL